MSGFLAFARIGRGWLAAGLLLAAANAAAANVEPRVAVEAALNAPVLLAGEPRTAYLKVGLKGFPMTAAARRPLVNMAIVLDKSGSMQGEKIAQARQAAEMALERLGPEDIVSIVLYDTAVQTLVPATKLADRETIYAKIRGIQAGGNTALFAGVSKGAAEARKFFSRDRVNRIVLLSDGLANVGPDSPAELGRLGVALAEEGIVVSTIGFGLDYNEDLMAELALRSDGHHYFAENGVDLARAFDVEFGEAVSVVAQNVTIEIECAEGMRPVRVLGRPAEIAGRRVVVQMSQLFGERERYAILELETPAAPPEAARPVAAVRVSYDNMATEQADTIAKRVSARFSADRAEADQALDKRVMADVVEQIAVENNRKAMALRDDGKIAEARDLLFFNRAYLDSNAAALDAPKLDFYAAQNYYDASNLDDASWGKQRKMMKDAQINVMQQAEQISAEKHIGAKP